MKGLAVAGLSWVALGCAIGPGALTSSGRTALVANSGRTNDAVAVGAYGGMMPSASFTFIEGLTAGTALTWNLHAGANLYVNGLGGTVEYQHRWDQVNWAGAFTGGSELHGVLGYFSIAPLEVLSFDLGAGAVFGGNFVMLGPCGELLQACRGAYMGAASGPRFAGRINLSVFGPASFWGMLIGYTRDPSTGLTVRTSGEGPILPITSALRLEVGYQRLSVQGPAALPRSVGALNIGIELLLGLF